MIKTLDIQTAILWLAENKITLIDVREEEEYNTGHIEQALLLPLSSLDLSDIPKEKTLVIYCRSGARSGHVCALLEAHYPTLEVYNLKGGILEWQAHNLPTCKKIIDT